MFKPHSKFPGRVGQVVIRMVEPFPETEDTGWCECVEPEQRMMLSGNPEHVLLEPVEGGDPKIVPMPKAVITISRRELVADGLDSVTVGINPMPLDGLLVRVGGERRRIMKSHFQVRTKRVGIIQIRIEDPYVREAGASLEGITQEEMDRRVG